MSSKAAELACLDEGLRAMEKTSDQFRLENTATTATAKAELATAKARVLELQRTITHVSRGSTSKSRRAGDHDHSSSDSQGWYNPAKDRFGSRLSGRACQSKQLRGTASSDRAKSSPGSRNSSTMLSPLGDYGSPQIIGAKFTTSPSRSQ